MKTNILRIAAFLPLLSLASSVEGCNSTRTENAARNSGAQTSDTPPPTAPATSTPTAPAGGIVVTVPPGWTGVTPSSVPAQYMKGTTTFIAKTEPIPDTNLDVIAAKATELFKKSFTNVVPEGEPIKLLVDGHEARKIVFTCQISGMNMKYIYVYLRVGAQTWALTFGGLADDFDSLSGDYQAILNQIRFQ